MTRLAVFSLLFLAACTPLSDAPQPTKAKRAAPLCEITKVIDGDTVKARCNDTAVGNLRLIGFDAPETYRARCRSELALGRDATDRLRVEIARARSIDIQMQGRDRYRRILARVFLDGRDVAAIMTDAGLAVPYTGGRRINWCRRLNGT